MPHPMKVPEILHGSDRFVSRFSWGVVAAALFLISAVPTQGQSVEVTQEENFRTEPNGTLIGVLQAGAGLTFVRRQDRWVEATLEGWMWTPSLQARTFGSYDLVVRAEGGENLRAAPSGQIMATLADGTLLEEVERIQGWIRVRRRGWVWGPSVSVDESAAPASSRPASSTPASSPPSSSTGNSRTPAAASSTRATAPAEVVRGPRPVLSAPDGDTLTVLAANSEVAVTARQGNWARVRIEGWVWQPPQGVGGDQGGQNQATAGPSLSPADVAANPEQARGRIVTWQLQFISLESAESVRTDFYEGELFLLTRLASASSGRFVYVAIPPDQRALVNGLVPLERLTVVARVRTGVSQLTGSPILDLIEIRR